MNILNQQECPVLMKAESVDTEFGACTLHLMSTSHIFGCPPKWVTSQTYQHASRSLEQPMNVK